MPDLKEYFMTTVLYTPSPSFVVSCTVLAWLSFIKYFVHDRKVEEGLDAPKRSLLPRKRSEKIKIVIANIV